jgi:glutathione S-transferase
MAHETYELYYWPGIPGRGEFIRLAFEDAGIPYVDVARLPEKTGGGIPAMMKVLKNANGHIAHFAPPILKVGDLYISQTPNILAYVAARHGLVPHDEAARAHAHQLQLTIADFLVEVHDIHHPLGSSLYYEEQKPESKKRALVFHKERLPKFLNYFERVLENNETGRGLFLIGSGPTYVDLSMFQVISGLIYAFPKAMARLAPTIPHLLSLRERVAARPKIAAYLASERRIPFNTQGIFRHYPELDDSPKKPPKSPTHPRARARARTRTRTRTRARTRSR